MATFYLQKNLLKLMTLYSFSTVKTLTHYIKHALIYYTIIIQYCNRMIRGFISSLNLITSVGRILERLLANQYFEILHLYNTMSSSLLYVTVQLE